MLADEYRLLAAEQRQLAETTSLTEVRRRLLDTAEKLEMLAMQLEQSDPTVAGLKDQRRRLDSLRSNQPAKSVPPD